MNLIKYKKARFFPFFLLAAAIFFSSCKGQPVANGSSAIKQEPDSAMQAYLRQEHRFEFRNYKMYYNGQLIKADSLSTVYKIFGRAQHEGEVFAYTDKPLSLGVKNMESKKDVDGYSLFEYEGKIYSNNSDQNWQLLNKGGKRIYYKDKEGIYKGIVGQYRIQLSSFKNPFSYQSPTEDIKGRMAIPPLQGYVLINGVLIDKHIQLQELRNKLGNIKNGGMYSMVGNPVIIYHPEPGHSFTEYDPKIDPEEDTIWIGFRYNEDNTELEAIDYYYSIKQ